jgi:hypothetical protein
MVAFLKRSVEELTPPQCDKCDRPMVWYRSMRASDVEKDQIFHYFHCTDCRSIKKLKVKFPEGDPPPPTQSAKKHGAKQSTQAWLWNRLVWY